MYNELYTTAMLPNALETLPPKRMKENISPETIESRKAIEKELPEFDGGCWEMLNQDAVQILPPRPKIPTRPTTSCIKPTFKEKEKKGSR